MNGSTCVAAEDGRKAFVQNDCDRPGSTSRIASREHKDYYPSYRLPAEPFAACTDRHPRSTGKPPRHGGLRNSNNSGQVSGNALSMAGPLSSIGVHKKKNRFSRNKRRSLGKKAAAAAAQGGQYNEHGPPVLADLRMENRRKTKRHFRGGGGKKAARARAAALTPGGGLFPVTPKAALGAPTVDNAALMGKNPHMAHLRSCSTPGIGFTTPGERGILGITSPFTGPPFSFGGTYDVAREGAGGPALDFFGSNEGLIRPVTSPNASTSVSESEMSDSENEEGNETQLPVLRGMELNMGEAENMLRQRQQELRINDQAGYIVQLEDDNLKLRGQLLSMEEELDKLRRMEDEHLNMQERLYLLEEELAQKNKVESNQEEEEFELPRDDDMREPRAWNN
eukprot:CAMPEP_0177763080 /NCGR_PEP_ID=MMETSP0491_2-20121128/6680_1 /TAXON_ID=63592 /ORGANISM="Tetraselmis chuii, Strain PLY429" /LENGTH=394 /DNA_ID=CAMNT_0019279163 /DNA_START=365 /DNA_END=1549 /DNA_ORIENTATION=-